MDYVAGLLGVIIGAGVTLLVGLTTQKLITDREQKLETRRLRRDMRREETRPILKELNALLSP